MNRRAIASMRVLAASSLMCAIVMVPATVRAQPGPTTLVAAAEPAQALTLTYSNRPITTFRARIFGRLPAERAAAVTRRFDEFVASRMTKPVTSRPEQGGVVITVGTRDVFALLPEDVDALAGETLEARGREAVANTSLALDEAVEARTPRDLINAILSSLGATVLFVGVLLIVRRLRRALAARLMATAERQLGRLPGAPVQAILPRDRILTFVGHLVSAGVLGILLVLAYTWLTFVLQRFPYTRPFGESLRQFLGSTIAMLGLGFIDALPGVFTVALIFAAAYFAVKISNAVFDAITDGRIQVPEVYVDTAVPTRRLVATLIWVFALIEAYPFVPGSDTDAFKGVSVLIGLMVSLGSAGLVNQVISSFTLTYSRALHPGDFVRIGSVEGIVMQVGVLSTKIRTPFREQVTIPNAVVVADTTTNYSQLALPGVSARTGVAIGYEVPWRQVEALLLMAAERTAGVRESPPAQVLQTGLEDFGVRYTLVVSLAQADQRVAIMNELHGQILDVFNEYGVQIMTPAYEGDPERPKTVPKDQWFSAPASVHGSHAVGT